MLFFISYLMFDVFESDQFHVFFLCCCCCCCQCLFFRMRKPNSSKLGRTVVRRKLIDLGRMLALRGGEVDSPPKPLDALAAAVGGSNMQIVCADDVEYDLDYMKYLTIFKESNHHHPHLLEREASPLRITYTTDKEVKRRGRRIRSEPPPFVSKKLESGTRKEDHKSTVFRKDVVLRGRKIAITKIPIKAEHRSKDIQQKKEAPLQRKKKTDMSTKSTIKLEHRTYGGKDTKKEKEVSLHKNTIKVESTSDVKDKNQEKEVARRGRKPMNAIPQAMFRASKRLKAEKIILVVNTTKDAPQGKKSCVTKSDFKASKKENEDSNGDRRKVKPHEIFRASKRLKTDQNWVNNKEDTKRKKEEEIHVNKDKAKPKSTSHVKDSLLHSFKAHKNLMDKSYEYFLAYLRNSVTVLELKPEKASVPLSDPDIIAVSNCPFSDGGPSPFEANKDGKVIVCENLSLLLCPFLILDLLTFFFSKGS